MQTRVIKQEPAITISNGDWEKNYDRHVSWDELKASKVGDVFDSPGGNVCGRGAYDEELRIIYKVEDGFAGLLSADCTTDDPNPEDYERVELIWFQF
jgi:hypothetical protein